jgi:hypothetical protein
MVPHIKEKTKNNEAACKVIDEQFANYKQGRLGKDDFACQVYAELTRVLKTYRVFHKDEALWADFPASLFSKVNAAIDRYSEKKDIPFSRYMFSLLKYWRIDWRSKARKNGAAERRAWQMRADEAEAALAVSEPDMEYMPEMKEAVASLRTRVPLQNPQQILMLALKSYYCLSDDLLDAVSSATGVSIEQLLRLIEALHQKRQTAEKKFFGLREMMFGQYYKNISMERELRFHKEEGLPLGALQAQMAQGRRRQAALHRKLKNMRMQASNNDVAELLGVTKGLVDYTLSTLKTRYMKPHNFKPDASASCKTRGSGVVRPMVRVL